MNQISIRAVQAHDAAGLAEIYNYYITDTVVTFEEETISAADMWQRVEAVLATGFPWLVAVEDSQVLGYAYAMPWKARSAYRFTVEATVYLDHRQAGKKIGSALYERLFEMLQARGIHSIIAGIALPNAASVALHEKFGMHKVAHFKQTGYKFGEWIDVGYWQKMLKKPRAD